MLRGFCFLIGDEGYKQNAAVAAQPGFGRTPRGESFFKQTKKI